MSSDTGPVAPQGNRTTFYLLGVIVILLVIVAAIVVLNKNQTPATPTASNDQASQLATPTSNQMPGIAPSTGEFDPATATKVTAKSPEEHVKQYYQAILDKKWDVAFKMQPASSQAGGSVEDFQATQTSYGMTAFKVLGANTAGDTSTVDVEQDLGSNGTWGAVWTFVKYKGAWVVQSRKVSMK